MTTCSVDGRCVLINDAAEPVAARVRATVLNTMTGVEMEVFTNLSVSVPAGAGASKRWCALGAAPSRNDCVPQTYTVPTNRYGYNAVLTSTDPSACEKECLQRQANATSVNSTCVGFTLLGSDCWLYPVVDGLSRDPAATWYVAIHLYRNSCSVWLHGHVHVRALSVDHGFRAFLSCHDCNCRYPR